VRVRELTRRRATEIRERISHLDAMASALENLADCCACAPKSQSCPIIAALAADPAAELSEPQEPDQTAHGAKRHRHPDAVAC